MSSKKTVYMSLIFVILVIPYTASSEAPGTAPNDKSVHDLIVRSLSKGKGICTVVGDMIKGGTDCSRTVYNAIAMGHPACVVVRCAVEAGGRLEEVITAAYRSGATSDIIVTCLIEGGADPDAVARTIERLGLPGLGYTPPPAAPVYSPTFAPSIGGGGGGTGIVSPKKP
jgi:hypothetical protein